MRSALPTFAAARRCDNGFPADSDDALGLQDLTEGVSCCYRDSRNFFVRRCCKQQR